MSAIKNQMDSSIKDIVKKQLAQKGDNLDSADVMKGVQSQEIFQNIVQIEVDKLKKEAKEKISQYEDKLQKKNKTINDLLTESENRKTELVQMNAKMTQEKLNEEKLKGELSASQHELDNERKVNVTTVGGQTKLIADKDNKIKGLESKVKTLEADKKELANHKSAAPARAEKADQSLFYQIERFEANFNRDVKSYLLIARPKKVTEAPPAPAGKGGKAPAPIKAPGSKMKK